LGLTVIIQPDGLGAEAASNGTAAPPAVHNDAARVVAAAWEQNDDWGIDLADAGTGPGVASCWVVRHWLAPVLASYGRGCSDRVTTGQ